MAAWRKIPGFDNYSVSDEGDIRNDDTQRILQQAANQQDIATVGLMHDGIQYRRSVARLVAEAFLEDPGNANFDTPIHLNGDRSNCSAVNLRWRPRWFAVRYHQQFHDDHEGFVVPIQDIDTGEVYENSWEACLQHGLIERELVQAMLRRTHVFPTFQEFRVYRD